MAHKVIGVFSCMDWRVWEAFVAYVKKKYEVDDVYLVSNAGCVRDFIPQPDLSKVRSIAAAYDAGVRIFTSAMHGGGCAGYKDLAGDWNSAQEERLFLEAEGHDFALGMKRAYDDITFDEYFVEIGPDNITVQDIVLVRSN